MRGCASLVLALGLLAACGASDSATEQTTETSVDDGGGVDVVTTETTTDTGASDSEPSAPETPADQASEASTSEPESDSSQPADEDGDYELVPYVHSSGRMEASFPDNWEVIEGDDPDLPEFFASIDLAEAADDWDVDRIYMYYLEGTSEDFAAAVADNDAAADCGEPLLSGDPYIDGDKEIHSFSFDCDGTNVVVRGLYEMSKGGGIVYWLQYDAEPSFEADFEMVTAITDSMQSN